MTQFKRVNCTFSANAEEEGICRKKHTKINFIKANCSLYRHKCFLARIQVHYSF